MAFRDFRYPDVIRALGLTERSDVLFPGVAPLPAGAVVEAVRRTWARLATLVHTEKARSEWLVALLLADLWERAGDQFNLHSGVEFDGDAADGLNGTCDFLIGRGPQLPHITAPVLLVFEAKRDSIPDGYGQCIAGMVGAERFNRREGGEAYPIHGCVTTGTQWRFLALSDTAITIDRTEYTVERVEQLLGILAHIIGVPVGAPA